MRLASLSVAVILFSFIYFASVLHIKLMILFGEWFLKGYLFADVGVEGYCQPCLLLPVSKLKAGIDRNFLLHPTSLPIFD